MLVRLGAIKLISVQGTQILGINRLLVFSKARMGEDLSRVMSQTGFFLGQNVKAPMVTGSQTTPLVNPRRPMGWQNDPPTRQSMENIGPRVNSDGLNPGVCAAIQIIPVAGTFNFGRATGFSKASCAGL